MCVVQNGFRVAKKELYFNVKLRLDDVSLRSMMLKSEGEMIAVCGLDCGSCDIRKAPHDLEAAQRIVAWFKKEGWLKENEGINKVIERHMYCKGCRGDRSVHWSPDCWILKCCVDNKGHEFCYECSTFPCEQLSKWAKQSDHYGRAFDRLKEKCKQR